MREPDSPPTPQRSSSQRGVPGTAPAVHRWHSFAWAEDARQPADDGDWLSGQRPARRLRVPSRTGRARSPRTRRVSDDSLGHLADLRRVTHRRDDLHLAGQDGPEVDRQGLLVHRRDARPGTMLRAGEDAADDGWHAGCVEVDVSARRRGRPRPSTATPAARRASHRRPAARSDLLLRPRPGPCGRCPGCWPASGAREGTVLASPSSPVWPPPRRPCRDSGQGRGSHRPPPLTLAHSPMIWFSWSLTAVSDDASAWPRWIASNAGVTSA